MTNKSLSPTAQAVLDAATDVYWDWGNMSPASSSTIAAAALRAAADQVVPIEYETIQGCWYEKENNVREQLLAIAAELENN